jgi:hypothetical protein
MTYLNDEGFSEEVRLAEETAATSQEITSASAVPEWILALPDSQRSGMSSYPVPISSTVSTGPGRLVSWKATIVDVDVLWHYIHCRAFCAIYSSH